MDHGSKFVNSISENLDQQNHADRGPLTNRAVLWIMDPKVASRQSKLGFVPIDVGPYGKLIARNREKARPIKNGPI